LKVGEIQFRLFVPQVDPQPFHQPGAAGHQNEPQERTPISLDEKVVKVDVAGDVTDQEYTVHDSHAPYAH
jgi:hypothetical protein